MRRRSLILVLAWSAVAITYDAQAQVAHYYERKSEGWWWKEYISPAPEKPQEPPPAIPAPQVSTELVPLSPAWLREKLPEFRDRAIDDPSPDNVRAYFQLQRFAMDKAEQFAAVAQRVVLADPELDENNRRPLSSSGAQLFDELARQQIERIAAKVAAQAGVWYFYRSDCPYCAAESPVLERLARRIGLAVLPIALDGQALPDGRFPQFVTDQGHAQALGVKQTPTLYLVKPPDQFIPLTEGLTSDEELLRRIVLVGHEAGWVSDEEFESTRPIRNPVIEAARAPLTPEEAADPVKLIAWLRAAASR